MKRFGAVKNGSISDRFEDDLDCAAEIDTWINLLNVENEKLEVRVYAER